MAFSTTAVPGATNDLPTARELAEAFEKSADSLKPLRNRLRADLDSAVDESRRREIAQKLGDANQAYGSLMVAAGKAIDEDLAEALAQSDAAANDLRRIVNQMEPRVKALAASEAAVGKLVGIASTAV